MMKLQAGSYPFTSQEIHAYSQSFKTRAATLEMADRVRKLDQTPCDLDPAPDRLALRGAALGERCYTGMAKMGTEKQVVHMAVDCTQGEEKFRYTELGDGTKIFAAPASLVTYQVVMECPNGTLFMEETLPNRLDETLSGLVSGHEPGNAQLHR